MVVVMALKASTASGQTLPPKVETAPRAGLLCAADLPLVHPGESVIVRAWIVGVPDEQAARRWQWRSALGSIQGAEVATWRFAPGDLPKEGNTVTATVEAASAGNVAQSLRCDVDILLAEKPEASGGESRGSGLTAHAFLLNGEQPPPGYGMYSYLLLDAPTDDIETRRHVNALAIYLMLIRSAAEMKAHLRPGEFNLALLPVKRDIKVPEEPMTIDAARALAVQVLKNYDYARAQELLLAFCVTVRGSGPFLVASRDRDGCRRSRLLMDLTQTQPDLVPQWIRSFRSLATAERSWGNDTMTALMLNSRNIIATSYRDIATAAQDLARSVRMLDAQP